MAGTDAHHVRIAEQDSPTIDPHNDTEDAAGVHQADEAESSLPVSVGTGQKKKKKKKSGKKSRLKKGSVRMVTHFHSSLTFVLEPAYGLRGILRRSSYDTG